MSDTISLAQTSIEEGSKSFSLAARLFPHGPRLGAYYIYFWCRYCDDVIDKGGSLSELETLRTETLKLWDNNSHQGLPPFLAFKEAVTQFQIPKSYPLELLEGMRMDLLNKSYNNFYELKLYCYRVASTVGLMMCHVMGLNRESALKEAASLGIAMQLTNIARDVKEDFQLGRTYLPLEWLQAEGLDQKNYMQRDNREKLFRVIRRLLAMAETYYQEGLKGLDALSWRSALTILCALRIYREIGRKIIATGPEAIEQRIVVSKTRKFIIVLISFVEMLFKSSKWLKAKDKISLKSEWRFS